MKMLLIVNSFVFAFSMLGILLVFFFNPLLIWIVYLIKGKKTFKYSPTHPSVSLITVVHNAENIIVDKIKNSLALNYPSGNYEIIVFSDGSTDETENKVKPFTEKKFRFLCSPTHDGKSYGINKAVQNSSGEVIVFSDADAMLEPNAIINLVKHFADPEVGGVCGKCIIYEDISKLAKAQSSYLRFDSTIKKIESQIGFLTSSTGTLCTIRKDLFQPIPPGVTDDLYLCLSIIKQNHRFLFEPDAKAFIKASSRSSAHEVERRRRIVNRSLTGIYIMRELFNPLKYGLFSISLLINKCFRRLLPFFLIFMFSSSLFLSFYIPPIKVALYLQIVFYLLALSYRLLFQHLPVVKIATRLTSLAFYFCLGNYGTLFGVLDFLMGKQIVKWNPQKTD